MNNVKLGNQKYNYNDDYSEQVVSKFENINKGAHRIPTMSVTDMKMLKENKKPNLQELSYTE